jgi:transposase
MRTSVNISFFVSAESAASTASKKDYRSTAYNNYSADLVDFDNEVYTFEVEARTESEASDKAERIAFEMGIQVSYINIYKV